MRASRGLKWENKMYKPKRSIEYDKFGIQPISLHDLANVTKVNQSQSESVAYFLTVAQL